MLTSIPTRYGGTLFRSRAEARWAIVFDELGLAWDYEREGWARRFFENWKSSLKWQRLKPYEKFAAMVERHWDGIASYCKPENKVPLGFVEGLNNKIRVIQRRAYGLRDEEYLLPNLDRRSSRHCADVAEARLSSTPLHRTSIKLSRKTFFSLGCRCTHMRRSR